MKEIDALFKEIGGHTLKNKKILAESNFLLFEDMKKRVIYRVEKVDKAHGMYYNSKGEFTNEIAKVCPNNIAKDIDMSYNKIHRKDGKRWYSGARSIESLKEWFSAEDARTLLKNGFGIFKIISVEYNELETEILFTREGIVSIKQIPFEEIYSKKRRG